MTMIDERARDLELLDLLIRRVLETDHEEVRLASIATTAVIADRGDEKREEIMLSLDLAEKLAAVVTDWRLRDARADVRTLCTKADDFALSTAWLWHQRHELKTLFSDVGAAVRREMAKAARRELPYRLDDIALSPVEAGSTRKPVVRVRLERLRDSLLPETIAIDFEDAEQVRAAFAEMFDTQTARRTRRDALRTDGADGEIDAVALRMMQLQGCDVPAILAKLPTAKHGILDVALPQTAGRHIVLFWRDGIVHSNFSLTETVQWREGSLSFKEAPKPFPAKPHGRELSDFIKHEALPAGLLVSAGYQRAAGARVDVPLPTARFNAALGTAWAT